MAFHRLMKYGEPLSVRKAHPSLERYSYKCAAGLKTLLVEYLLMQIRHLTGEERIPKTREEMTEVSGGIPFLTDLCLAMRARGGSNLPLRARRDIRLPGSTGGGVPTFNCPRESDQYFGRNSAELVRGGELESTNE